MEIIHLFPTVNPHPIWSFNRKCRWQGMNGWRGRERD